MNYKRMEKGIFLKRPNRFIAHIQIGDRVEICHVKNTGRCQELLVPGAEVMVQKCEGSQRKTAYDLISVKKGELLVNMDSQVPNQVVEEWLRAGNLVSKEALICREKTYGSSRFDFYIEDGERKIFMEVKGVTLENQGVVKFPDAPSIRAVKHIRELIECQKEGYEAYVFFVVQLKGARYFMPNEETQPEFAAVLREAREKGVKMMAYDCKVTEDSIEASAPVPIMLHAESEKLLPIVEPLLQWFEHHARILPWREDASPYRVWVSEIMLQQTRVEAVKPFFERFTQALPGIADLAEAQEEVLLKLWEGLGYYNRVRNMQKAAQVVMEQYQGRMPASYEALLDLPGIGEYTAGAVASIAYGIPVPAVDGNVLRVISRILASREDILKPAVKKKIREFLLEIMPVLKPGEFNQALMELGATVCIPNGMAKCEECPVAEWCEARRQNIVMEIPIKKAKKERRLEEKTVLVIWEGNRVAIRKRSKKGLLAGLYELPNLSGHRTMDEILEYLKEKGLSPIRIWKLDDAKHIFSHVEWKMTGYAIRIEEQEVEPEKREADTKNQDGEWMFIEPVETEKRYPIPAAFLAYAKYMNIKLGQEKYLDQYLEQ